MKEPRTMFKMIAFLTFAPHLTREAARDYYETRHVPLITSLMPDLERYQRNHLAEQTAGIDVVTELWFADEATANRAIAAAQENPEVARRIAEDEANFLDRSSTRLVAAEENA